MEESAYFYLVGMKWWQMDARQKDQAGWLAGRLSEPEILKELALWGKSDPDALELWKQEMNEGRNKDIEISNQAHAEHMQWLRSSSIGGSPVYYGPRNLDGNPVRSRPHATEYGSVSNPVRRRIG